MHAIIGTLSFKALTTRHAVKPPNTSAIDLTPAASWFQCLPPIPPSVMAHLAFFGLVLGPGVQVMVGALRVLVQVVDQPRGIGDHMLYCMARAVVGGGCCSCLLLLCRITLILVLYSLRNCKRTPSGTDVKSLTGPHAPEGSGHPLFMKGTGNSEPSGHGFGAVLHDLIKQSWLHEVW